MSNKDLIEQLRKANGVGRWTRAMLTAADRLEANDAEIAELGQQVKLLRVALGSIALHEMHESDVSDFANKALADPVTDDDFLHIANESNFAQERE